MNVLSKSFLVVMLLALVGLAFSALGGVQAVAPAVQLGIHPLYTHAADICDVRGAFCRPECKPGNPEYQEYWSDRLHQFLFICYLPEVGRYAIWVVAQDGTNFYEVTGFFGRLKYIMSVVVRDGYVLLH